MPTSTQYESTLLNLQLLLGSALQAVYLVDSDVQLDSSEIAMLRTAATLVADIETFDATSPVTFAVRHHAIVAATAESQGSGSVGDLATRYRELADALSAMADGNEPTLAIGEIIERLRALHDFAQDETVRQLDEVR